MSFSSKIPFALGRIAAATALIFVAGTARGQIVADGRLETANYQLGFSVGFTDDTGQAIGDGRIYFGSFAAGQFLYFQMPLAYVDNTYGTNASSGWATTKNGTHTFSDLLGSDSFGSVKKGAGTGFGWGANSVQIDYIAGAGCDSSGKGVGCTSYRSGGVGDATLQRVDGQVYSGSATSILEMATSLEYNLNLYPLYDNSPASVAAAPNWIYEVGYEIQFAPNTFDAASWIDPSTALSLITLGSSHVSPSMKRFGDYGDPMCIQGCVTSPIPEPETYAMLLAGLGMLAWARRRRKNQ